MNPSPRAVVLAAVMAVPVAVRAASAAAPEDATTSERCPGRGGPGTAAITDGPRYDWRSNPLPQDWRETFENAGYRFEPGGQVLSPRNGPLPEAEIARLLSPFDGASDAMDADTWERLAALGYRPDGASCRLLDSNGFPLRRIQLEDFRRGVAQSAGQAAVAALVARLRGLDPNAPPPPELLDQVRGLQKSGLRLPEDLSKALAAGQVSSGRLVEGLSADAAARWEGERSLSELQQDARPPVLEAVPVSPRGSVEPLEQQIGDALSQQIQARFALTPSGRELLDHFRNSRGALELPSMTVLKLSQNPGETETEGRYDLATRSFTLDHWNVVKCILQDAAPADRAPLQSRLTDARALSAYLRAHPEAAAKLADRLDVMTFHELTHAWQARRQALAVERERKNVPALEPIEWEHEAYFAQMRYMHDKLMRDPKAALRDGENFSSYLSLLQSPQDFRDSITRLYMSGNPTVSDFGVIREIQGERRSFLETLSDSARRVLEQAGLKLGDAAIDQAESDERIHIDRLTALVPAMRQDAAKVLPGALEKAGRPDAALAVLNALPPAVSAQAADPARRKTLADEAARLPLRTEAPGP